jgi:hypothetical protein
MNLKKRINTLEALHAQKKELPSAWVAQIAVDGKVKLSHAKHETIHLNNRDELQDFIKDNDLEGFQVLIVDIVNARGKPPIEL